MESTKYRFFVYSFSWILFLVAGAANGKDEVSGLFLEGGKLQKISSEFSFTEGPAVDKKGNVYFTDQPNDRIYLWDAKENKISLYMEKSGRSNGLYLDKNGNILAAADEKSELWKIDKNKKVTVLVDGFKGRRLNGPNDIWVSPKGGLFFTDPYYQRDYWNRKSKDIEKENVYFLSKKNKVTIAHDNFNKPNGIVGSPDGKLLYVGDFGAEKIYRFKISRKGRLKNKKEFAAIRSDGLTIDDRGNIYATGDGVSIFSPDGKKIEYIDIEEGWTSNVCFAGENRDILFITALNSVYTVKMKVKGVN